MISMTGRTLRRTIRGTMGRYLAILAIVALGVGFFSGLKATQPAMRETAQSYLSRLNMYDLLVMSSYGFTADDVEALTGADGVTAAEGVYRADVLAAAEGGREEVYQLLSLPDEIGLPDIIAGRAPQEEWECLGDSELFTEDDIGKKITISADDEADSVLSVAEYTITGIAQSPRFISPDRGSTSLGDGKLAGFLYVSKEAFASEVYHEVYIKCDTVYDFFTDGYKQDIENTGDSIEQIASERARQRYDDILADAEKEIDDARKQLLAAREAYEAAKQAGLPEDMLSAMLEEIEEGEKGISDGESYLAQIREPAVYVLDYGQNTGLATFENDTVIVSGIADVFPAFFVLIAALVCLTTMTRMANDERTVVGTLKAMGYSGAVISLKYVFYASSASLIGCVAGFFLGTGVIPRIIWSVYGISYSFSTLKYHFSGVMFICCTLISVLGSAAVTLLSCRRELKEEPAGLVRPKAPGNGKRILLERITPLWKRMTFLGKVTVRNALRYKKRMFMMLLGVGGCTALIVTGFGLKDSVANILNYQYDEIMTYDAYVTFDGTGETLEEIEKILADNGLSSAAGYCADGTLLADGSAKEATVIVMTREDSEKYFTLRHEDNKVEYPGLGEAVVSTKLAELLGVSRGDTAVLRLGSQDVSVTVSGICDNYLGHYIYIAPSTAGDLAENTVYFGGDVPDDIYAKLRGTDGVTAVTVASEERDMMDRTMSGMNYIVALIIVCAGALAFIVLYNLMNINIMERMREVATVKVLGFNSAETATYALRENLVLSLFGAVLGLGLGVLLHRYVMAQIHVDIMTFDVHISLLSYLLSFLLTMAFAVLTNLVMRVKLRDINMAESLKSVE